MLSQFQLIIQNQLSHQKLSACHIDSGSHSLQSLLHFAKGLAEIIQLPQETIGWTHLGLAFQAIFAGHQKHTAIHCHHVIVGVQNFLIKFDDECVHKYQPAHRFLSGIGLLLQLAHTTDK